MHTVFVGLLATAISLLVALLVSYRGSSNARSLYSEISLTLYMETWRGLRKILLENAIAVTAFLALRTVLLVWAGTLLPSPPTNAVGPQTLLIGIGIGSVYAVAYRFITAFKAEALRRQDVLNTLSPKAAATAHPVASDVARSLTRSIMGWVLPLAEMFFYLLSLDWLFLDWIIKRIENDRQQCLGAVVRSAIHCAGNWRNYAALLQDTLKSHWGEIINGMRRTQEDPATMKVVEGWVQRPPPAWQSNENQNGLIVSAMARALTTEGLHIALKATAKNRGLQMRGPLIPALPLARFAWRIALGGALVFSFVILAIPAEASEKPIADGISAYTMLAWLVFFVCFVLDAVMRPGPHDQPPPDGA